MSFTLGEPDKTIKIIQMRIREDLDHEKYVIRVKNAEKICDIFLKQTI